MYVNMYIIIYSYSARVSCAAFPHVQAQQHNVIKSVIFLHLNSTFLPSTRSALTTHASNVHFSLLV